jgi:hypothetical protein
LTDNEHGYYIALAQILVSPSVAGTFTLTMWPGTASRKAPQPGCDNVYQPELSCEAHTGANGQRIWVETGNYQGTATVEYKVKMYLTDGTILVATASSAVIDPGVYPTPGPQSTRPPLTTDDLLALLSIPGLTLARS